MTVENDTFTISCYVCKHKSKIIGMLSTLNLIYHIAFESSDQIARERLDKRGKENKAQSC